ncbi:J domain-containing protein [Sphingomonas piscis]|uniref:J domain-containing protein n=1 Tax=Sphingomonas piscis TaxID=2714943 RepID=UPI0019D0C081|nr:J domain-containing protein [Sphingomonas piscis]
MTAEAAYQTLGLEPGASEADVDRAYRTLIKRFHPDREGGDATRAAEINQAYFQLRKCPAPEPEQRASTLAEALYARRASQFRLRRKRKARIWPVALVGILVAAYLQWDRIAALSLQSSDQFRELIEPSPNDGTEAALASGRPASLDEPIGDAAVSGAIGLATRLLPRGGEAALAEESRDCHQKLRAAPTLERLDTCAAFDDAVLELLKRDPLREDGPFAASAVTARQINAATLLSGDYLAIDARLDRVRAKVQALMAPAEPDAPVNSSLP